MGSIKVNFAEVEGGFEPVPEGAYEVVVEKVEVRESNSSDHDYLNWELKITDDDHENQRLWMITSLSPRALFRLKDVFAALGVIDPTDDDQEIDIEWDDEVQVTPKAGPRLLEPDVEGMAALAIVRNEVYDGKERNRVDDLRATSNGSGASSPKKAAKPRNTQSKAAPRRRALR